MSFSGFCFMANRSNSSHVALFNQLHLPPAQVADLHQARIAGPATACVRMSVGRLGMVTGCTGDPTVRPTVCG